MKLLDAINRVRVMAAGAASGLLVASGPALAHDVVAGVGGFWGGLAHPLLVPAHALALVALGLTLGQTRRHRAGLGLFVAGLVAGIGLIVAAFAVATDRAILAATVAAGLALAVGQPLPLTLSASLAAIAGAAIAFDSVPQDISMWTTFLALLGTAVSASIAVGLVSEMGHRLKRDWQRIGVRILGSWIAAAAILVLALRLAS